jgi:hypothetical protein
MLTDAPILPAKTSLTGGEKLGLVDNDGLEKQLKVNGILGLLAGDVDDSVANADTIATRLSVVVGTTPTVTLPAVAGNLREVIVINTASGNCTLDTPGSEKILTGTAEADTLVIATGKAAKLLSNGTRWYHVSNDA